MPRQSKKWHYIYKTTNKINEKFYVGMHSTNNLEDGYIGSGKYLWNSIRKHGRENFEVEFLEFFDSREKLRERESFIVTEDFITNPLCMNLKRGGDGGFTTEAYKKGAKKMNEIIWNDPDYIKRAKDRGSKLFKRLHEEGIIKPLDWTGRKHNQKSKIKMSDKAKLRIGNKNSQFGTCWITKNGINKKINKENLAEYEIIGWNKGRICG